MKRAIVAACALAIGGTAAAEPPLGWYAAELVREDGVRIPFHFFLAPEGGRSFIRNGEEDLPIAARLSGESLLIDFPHFDSRITARRGPLSLFEGEWTKASRNGAAVAMKFRALDVAKFDPSRSGIEGHSWGVDWDTLEATHDSRWRMAFGESGEAIGMFSYRFATPAPSALRTWVTGSIETPTGDYRFLSGTGLVSSAITAPLSLSVFDGAHAFLFTAEVDQSGDTMTGHFYSGPTHHETFTATRLKDGETFDLPDPFSEVALKPGETRLGLPVLNDPPYKGAPTIVQVFGSWCPNCHDEAPVLKELYDRYAPQGLQVLGLAYEHLGKHATPAADERAKRQVERFRERHGLPWRIEVAGSSDKAHAAATLPALSAIKAFPTTIFLNADGTVRVIHSGFAGPATGDDHEKLKAEFDRLAREILASGTPGKVP